MNDDLTKREQLSALADGELSAAELQAALAYAQSDAGQQEWRMYHLVGDVLRSPELAHHSRHDLLSGIRSQLANEPRRPWFPSPQTSWSRSRARRTAGPSSMARRCTMQPMRRYSAGRWLRVLRPWRPWLPLAGA